MDRREAPFGWLLGAWLHPPGFRVETSSAQHVVSHGPLVQLVFLLVRWMVFGCMFRNRNVFLVAPYSVLQNARFLCEGVLDFRYPR